MTTSGSLDDVDVGVVVVCGGIGVVGPSRHTFSIHFLDYDLHSDPNLLLVLLLLVHTLVTLHPVSPPLYVALVVLVVSLVLIQRQRQRRRRRLARDQALLLLFLLVSNGLSNMTSSDLDQRAASSRDQRRCDGSGCCGRGRRRRSGNSNRGEGVHRVRRLSSTLMGETRVKVEGEDVSPWEFENTALLPSFDLVVVFPRCQKRGDR
jgi:hypothetical protein